MKDKNKKKNESIIYTDEGCYERVVLLASETHNSVQVIDVAVRVGHQVFWPHFQLHFYSLQ